MTLRYQGFDPPGDLDKRARPVFTFVPDPPDANRMACARATCDALDQAKADLIAHGFDPMAGKRMADC